MAMVSGLHVGKEVFAWLQKACEGRSIWLVFMAVHPRFAELLENHRIQ
jgi:hypothetical protein